MDAESKNKLSVIIKRLESLGKDIKELADGIDDESTSKYDGVVEEVETLTEISNWLLQLKVDLDELMAEQDS
jgi:hypothetical protein